MSIHKSTFWGPFWAIVAFATCVRALSWVGDIPTDEEIRTTLMEAERESKEANFRLQMVRWETQGAGFRAGYKCSAEYGDTECDPVLADSIVNGLGRWAAYKR